MAESLKFSLKRDEIPVVLTKEDGQPWHLTMRELTGSDRATVVSMLTSRIKISPQGKPIGLRSVEGLQSKLLHLSLYDDVEGKRIEVKVIEEWPAKMQTSLFEAAQRLSGLDSDDDDEDSESDPP